LVDESLLSGESAPVVKRRGDPLVAGSLVTEGPAEIRVDRVGADTALAAIVALVTRAQVARPRLAQTGERVAGLFVARILALTGLTAAIWIVVDPARAFDAAIAVLVVSCPCAFALAVPAALTRSLAVLARRGVLVVKPDAIETLAGASHVVFDKTGTLTDRRLRVERVQVLGAGCTETEVLRLAAALARESRHPASQAIVAAASVSNDAARGEDCGAPFVADHPVAHAGAGMEAMIDGRLLRLGRPDFALGAHDGVMDDIADAVVLAGEQGPIAAFHLGEQLRPDARQAIDALGALGLQVEILSGDAPQRVAAVAHALGVDSWRARQLPQDKLARLAQLRSEGARVVVVGDGVNDAPILAGADVAVAMASGADIAQASSDIVLANESLPALAGACALVRHTCVVLRQNQRWAIAYNLAAVPLAALGFVPPWLAAIGMSLSSLLVVLNAMRIGRPDRGRSAEAGYA
ncbi:MAG: heavy metal translocating P-type ATPase, partial [Lautropia sp.]